MDATDKALKLRETKLGPQKLRTFFISHLNRIYCAKSHLLERLPEIAKQAEFLDLRQAIAETREDVARQLERMERIFVLMNARISFDDCDDLTALIEYSFSTVHMNSKDAQLRDMSILFYMQNVESMEMTSFKILQLAAAHLNDDEVNQLLLENFDEAKADRALLAMITAKYMVN